MAGYKSLIAALLVVTWIAAPSTAAVYGAGDQLVATFVAVSAALGCAIGTLIIKVNQR